MAFNALLVEKDEDGNTSASVQSLEDNRLPDGNVTVELDINDSMPVPNGVGLDNNGELIVGEFFLGNVLVQKEGELVPLKGQFRGADAVEQSDAGDYYVSSWSQGKVWRIDAVAAMAMPKTSQCTR